MVHLAYGESASLGDFSAGLVLPVILGYETVVALGVHESIAFGD